MSDEKSILTLKQRIFVDAYLGPAKGNATEAARLAGYAKPAEQGYENLRKPHIRQAVDDWLFAHAMSAGEVLRGLTEHARGTLAHFVRQSEDGEVFTDLGSQSAKDYFHLLKRVKTKKRSGGRDEGAWTETEIEIELHDPQSAYVHLGRYHKLFTDRTEGSVAVSGVIGYDIIPPDGSGDGDAGTQDRLSTTPGTVEGVEQ